MSSPIANPAPIVNTINGLSKESLSIDNGIATAKRDAAAFAENYGNHFQMVAELKDSTAQFSDRWVKVLLDSRDAASAIAVWYRRFSQVFLGMVSDIQTEGDRDDVVTEFKGFLEEGYPSAQFRLDSIAGLKQEFNNIEALVPQEIQKTMQVLQSATGPEWKQVIEKLQQDLVPVKAGSEQIERAFTGYASNLSRVYEKN
ncbi:hypothetical protein DFP72DRAFT_929593 [Ephemerocybe angulata]|uniref:Uncharacterized protein n=1 Tax=Ephemerocybe angulata TaxID=980116 RepID=A0A8H6HD76_9AGAR|nr:hypothetical protein DFP72DRAFT_929593 [Tulosesus angulatus]